MDWNWGKGPSVRGPGEALLMAMLGRRATLADLSGDGVASLAGGSSHVDRVVLQGLAAFRWAAWVWMVILLFIGRDDLARPTMALGAVVATLAMSAWATSMLHARPRALLDRRVVLLELAVGAALIVLDGVVAAEDTLFTTRQSLGSAWPFAGILGAGIAGGPIAGAIAGVTMERHGVTAVIVNGASLAEAGRVMSVMNTTVFYTLTGTVAGYLVRRLIRDEEQIATANARAEMARTLHDGVLQTLALVERRVDDPALARLARETERDLREFLAGTDAPPSDLASGLRQQPAAARTRSGHGSRLPWPRIRPSWAHARAVPLIGAVGEALTNAGKHGRPHPP